MISFGGLAFSALRVADLVSKEVHMPKKRQNREVKLPVLRSDAAGIDIGAEEIFVAVPADRDSEPVRRLRHFHGGFECVGRLADEMRFTSD
jgi:hypothetical protein